MTQIEREDLVERYLAGEMTAAQESEFFLHVAVDDELQRTLKAFRIMDKAILNDRESAVAERSQYREQVFGMLAATQAPLAGGTASTAGAPPVPAGAGASGAITGGGMAAGGLGAWKSVLISLVAGGLAIGTAAVVLPSILGGEKPAAQPAQVAPQVVAPGPGAVPGLAPSQGSVAEPSAAEPSVTSSPESAGRNAEAAAPATQTAPSQGSRASVREKSRPAGTSVKEGAGDEYLIMPPEKEKEIKIQTELEGTEKQP